MADGSPIFIPSKGRPDCMTARMLLDIGYLGRVVIVIGDDDETASEYIERFGSDMVHVFNKRAASEETDFKDAYGMGVSTGVAPARNYIMGCARGMGYDRCWQMDDDIRAFERRLTQHRAVVMDDGAELYSTLNAIEDVARSAMLGRVGLNPSFARLHDPRNIGHIAAIVMNVATDGSVRYDSRMFEDTVSSIDMLRTGRVEYAFNHVSPIQDRWYGGMRSGDKARDGGLRDHYESLTGVRDKSAMAVRLAGYSTIALPNSISLRVRSDKSLDTVNSFGKCMPMVIRESWEV